MRRTRLHRKGIVSSVVVAMTAVLALALSAGTAGAVGTLDQSQEGPTNWAVSGGTSEVAQTFTSGITGDLDQVDMLLMRPVTDPRPFVPLTVELQSVNAGVPGDVVLATATVQPEAVPIGDFDNPDDFSEDFAWISVPIGPVPVTQGTEYAIVAKSATQPDSGSYVWSATSGDPYPAGGAAETFSDPGNWTHMGLDMNFRTYVTPTPPPPPQQQCRIIRLSIGLGLGPPIVICL